MDRENLLACRDFMFPRAWNQRKIANLEVIFEVSVNRFQLYGSMRSWNTPTFYCFHKKSYVPFLFFYNGPFAKPFRIAFQEMVKVQSILTMPMLRWIGQSCARRICCHAAMWCSQKLERKQKIANINFMFMTCLRSSINSKALGTWGFHRGHNVCACCLLMAHVDSLPSKRSWKLSSSLRWNTGWSYGQGQSCWHAVNYSSEKLDIKQI